MWHTRQRILRAEPFPWRHSASQSCCYKSQVSLQNVVAVRGSSDADDLLTAVLSLSGVGVISSNPKGTMWRNPRHYSMDMSSALLLAKQFLLHKRDLQKDSGTMDLEKQHVLQRHTELIHRLKHVGIFDTETTEGENYQIAFPQVRSRLNSRGKIGLS